MIIHVRLGHISCTRYIISSGLSWPYTHVTQFCTGYSDHIPMLHSFTLATLHAHAHYAFFVQQFWLVNIPWSPWETSCMTRVLVHDLHLNRSKSATTYSSMQVYVVYFFSAYVWSIFPSLISSIPHFTLQYLPILVEGILWFLIRGFFFIF